MISLGCMSLLMQEIIARGASFMISPSGLPGFYSVYAACYGKTNRAVHLSLDEKQAKIVQSADEQHPTRVFCDVESVVRYICEELDLAYTKEGGKEDGQTE